MGKTIEAVENDGERVGVIEADGKVIESFWKV